MVPPAFFRSPQRGFEKSSQMFPTYHLVRSRGVSHRLPKRIRKGVRRSFFSYTRTGQDVWRKSSPEVRIAALMALQKVPPGIHPNVPGPFISQLPNVSRKVPHHVPPTSFPYLRQVFPQIAPSVLRLYVSTSPPVSQRVPSDILLLGVAPRRKVPAGVPPHVPHRHFSKSQKVPKQVP